MANLFDKSHPVVFIITFLQVLYVKVGEKNLPIRRKVVDGAKPIKSRPGGIRFSSTTF